MLKILKRYAKCYDYFLFYKITDYISSSQWRNNLDRWAIFARQASYALDYVEGIH